MAMALVPAAATIASAASSLVPHPHKKKRSARVRRVSLKLVGPRRVARRQHKGKKNAPGFSQVDAKSIDLSHPVVVHAPRSTTFVGAGRTFRITAMRGPVGDFDNDDGISVHFSTELPVGVQTGSDYSEDSKNGGLSTSTALAARGIKPSAMGSSTTRIFAMSQVFSHYRIRMMRLRYVPQSSSANTAAIYIAYTPDPDASGVQTTTTGVTPGDMREYRCSLVTPSWQPAEFTMTNSGSRYWAADASDSTDEQLQGLLLCIVRGGAASTVYGRIECDLIVDLAGTRKVLAAPVFDGRPPEGKERPSLGSNDPGDPKIHNSDVKEDYVKILPPPLSGRATSVLATHAPVSGSDRRRSVGV